MLRYESTDHVHRDDHNPDDEAGITQWSAEVLLADYDPADDAERGP